MYFTEINYKKLWHVSQLYPLFLLTQPNCKYLYNYLLTYIDQKIFTKYVNIIKNRSNFSAYHFLSNYKYEFITFLFFTYSTITKN